ncbi:MAG: sensor histidine kinase [Anaerolineae bacterium]|nr:sensor histidine kinase [Anaerolineae bacterium]
MFRKLRTRLILSHTLPLLLLALVLVPIIVYLLDTRYSLENLLGELDRQTDLIVEFGESDQSIWTDQASAQSLVDRLSPLLDSRVMILDSNGKLLSSSLDTDGPRVGQVLNADVIEQARRGEMGWEVDFNPFMQKRIVDMARPVFDKQGEIIGILRFSHDVAEIEQPIVPLRIAVFVALAIGIVTTLILSFLLSRSLNSPLARLSNAVTTLMPGAAQNKALPETGPEEVRTVAVSYNQLVHRLRQIERDRNQLLANIVHELGTSLGAIKSATHALQNGAISDTQLAHELIVGIASQLSQLGLLIDDLALLGETGIRELVIQCKWIDISALIRAKCQAYKHLVAEKQITLICHVADEPVSIYADPIRVGQILANLLQNAYKYMRIGGSIEVSLETEFSGEKQPNIVVYVKDTGPGIAPDEHESIFQLLYRSPSQRRLQQGMGIGLALARRLAEAHGGKLTVSSELGKGATFKLMLPLNVNIPRTELNG